MLFENIAPYLGLITSVWLFVGIAVVSKFYPNYDHARQFCSELGAAGSPTEKLSPLVNNYPLGLLFCFFGWYITQLSDMSTLIVIAGWLIILHGIGTWIAGYFPMDADPFTKYPSLDCKIHSWAGFIMLLSLLIAPVLIALSPTTEIITPYFKIFSIISVCLACYYFYAMAVAVKKQKNAGFYQRISYAIQLLWLSTFSLILV